MPTKKLSTVIEGFYDELERTKKPGNERRIRHERGRKRRERYKGIGLTP